jgi:hypothetical protein
MNKTVTLMAAHAVLLMSAFASAQSERVKARPRVWLSEFDGNFLGDTDTISGTELDARDDMGLNDEEQINWLEVMLSQGQGRTWLSYLDGDPKGDAVLSGDEILDGVTFPMGTSVEGTFDIEYIRMTREQFLTGKQILGMAVIISFLSGVEYMQMDFQMEGGGNSADKGMDYYRPQVGFRAEAWAKQWLTIEAHIITFPKWEFDDIRARTLEYQITATIRIERWSLEAGYRWTNFFAEEDKGSGEDIEVDIDMTGWFFGLGVSF